MIGAPLVVGVAGAWFERLLLRRVHARGALAEMLLTFGAAIVIGEGVKLVWGLGPVPATIPRVLDGALFTLFGASFARYRVFMMAVAIAMLAALWLVLRISKTGLVVRAALTHPLRWRRSATMCRACSRWSSPSGPRWPRRAA